MKLYILVCICVFVNMRPVSLENRSDSKEYQLPKYIREHSTEIQSVILICFYPRNRTCLTGEKEVTVMLSVMHFVSVRTN